MWIHMYIHIQNIINSIILSNIYSLIIPYAWRKMSFVATCFQPRNESTFTHCIDYYLLLVYFNLEHYSLHHFCLFGFFMELTFLKSPGKLHRGVSYMLYLFVPSCLDSCEWFWEGHSLSNMYFLLLHSRDIRCPFVSLLVLLSFITW